MWEQRVDSLYNILNKELDERILSYERYGMFTVCQ